MCSCKSRLQSDGKCKAQLSFAFEKILQPTRLMCNGDQRLFFLNRQFICKEKPVHLYVT